MVHTKNNKYTLIYTKGHTTSQKGVSVWIRTKWQVLDNANNVLWEHKGKIYNKQKSELLEKYSLDVKLN